VGDLSRALRCRRVHGPVELADLAAMMATLEDVMIPSFELTPHFLGVTAIKANAGSRAEVVITSFWDNGLTESEDEAERFVLSISQVTGRNPSQKNFDTLYAQLRDPSGMWPANTRVWSGRPRNWLDD